MYKLLFPSRSKFKSGVHFHFHRLTILLILLLCISAGFNAYRERIFLQQRLALTNQITALQKERDQLKQDLETVKNEDPRKTNVMLQEKIQHIEDTFTQVSTILENLSDARSQAVAVSQVENDLAQAVATLAQKNYEEAAKKLTAVNQKITELIAAKQAQIAAAAAPVAQEPPSAGSYRKQTVASDRGSFTVALIGEKAASVKMITDTENSDTCADNCPLNSLSTYVSRSSGFAGINGTYFCPADYPSCAGKVNSYNTLVFNSRLKKYMNSDQNVYSTVPMVVQNADHSMRFMGKTLEWGRDTGIIGGIANHPLLVSGGKSVVDEGSLDDKSRSSKISRGFIANKGDTVYIGVVFGATVGDEGVVLSAMGMDNAINLDGGGSSALFYNGQYVVGPGRNLPNAVILVH